MGRAGLKRSRKIAPMRVRLFSPAEKSVRTISMKPPSARVDSAGVAALVLGATGIGLAPILVRLSETGPVATAFYRLLLAQPIIWWLLKRNEPAHAEKRIERNDLRYAAL